MFVVRLKWKSQLFALLVIIVARYHQPRALVFQEPTTTSLEYQKLLSASHVQEATIVSALENQLLQVLAMLGISVWVGQHNQTHPQVMLIMDLAQLDSTVHKELQLVWNVHQAPLDQVLVVLN
jgi:hypothetical protein